MLSRGQFCPMATAEVGDDWYGDDPTVNRLQDRAAELTGKEAAAYLATGTMCGAQGRSGTNTDLAHEHRRDPSGDGQDQPRLTACISATGHTRRARGHARHGRQTPPA